MPSIKLTYIFRAHDFYIYFYQRFINVRKNRVDKVTTHIEFPMLEPCKRTRGYSGTSVMTGEAPSMLKLVRKYQKNNGQNMNMSKNINEIMSYHKVPELPIFLTFLQSLYPGLVSISSKVRVIGHTALLKTLHLT